MQRYQFRPRLDTLEPRLPLSTAAAAVDPTDPVDLPTPPGGLIIIAPVPPPSPTAPIVA